MKDITLRERLNEKFKSYYERGVSYSTIEIEMLAFIEQDIANARKEGEDKIKKEWDFSIRAGMNKKEMRAFIQSLN